jgi:hypothetical protein
VKISRLIAILAVVVALAPALAFASNIAPKALVSFTCKAGGTPGSLLGFTMINSRSEFTTEVEIGTKTFKETFIAPRNGCRVSFHSNVTRVSSDAFVATVAEVSDATEMREKCGVRTELLSGQMTLYKIKRTESEVTLTRNAKPGECTTNADEVVSVYR